MRVCGKGGFGESLHLPLNFWCGPKTALKKIKYFFKIETQEGNVQLLVFISYRYSS